MADDLNETKIIETVANKLQASIKNVFPDFTGFTDPRFIKREINYKQRFIRDAQKQLSKEYLQHYLNDEQYKAFYEAVLKIGRHKDNNLLYKGTPRSGDLALLHDETLDYKAFAEAFFNLIHGDGSGAERLDSFCDWVGEQGLKNKWTFVTYYLFVTNPDEELFIKPTEIKEFLEMVGKGDQWHHRPTGDMYQTIKDDFWAVGQAMPFEVKRGFLDLQSFVWTALAAEDKEIYDSRFTWVAVHKKIAQKLLDYEDKQEELINILIRVGVYKDTLKDEVENGTIPLREMDPFTFYCFIYKHGNERRLEILKNIAQIFEFEVPKDTYGIPSVNAQKVMLYPFKKDRTNEIDQHWTLFKAALDNNIPAELFSDAFNIYGVGESKLTEVLFMVAPERYFPIDSQTRSYLKVTMNIDPRLDESLEKYEAILNKVKDQSSKPFYQISHELCSEFPAN